MMVFMPLRQRIRIIVSSGAAIALLGVIVFLSAHAIATPAAGVSYNTAERNLHEMLWTAFAIALWLGGVLVAAVGLSAWCRDGT
jgi:hypothetical protein